MNTLQRFVRISPLLILIVTVSTAHADDGDDRSYDRTYTNERTGNSTNATASIVENEDGSKTYRKDRTFTTEDGESVTKSKTVDASRADDGQVSVDRRQDVETSDGRGYSTEQQSNFLRNEDGSGSLQRTGNTSVTNRNGETRTAENGRQVAWGKNDEGGRDVDASWDASTSEGRAGNGNASARTTRDGEGNGTFNAARDRETNRGSLGASREWGRQVGENGKVSRTRDRRRNRNNN